MKIARTTPIQHYYHTIQGWFPYDFLYSEIVYRCNHFNQYKFVEIGSWKGRSSVYMAVEILNSKKNIEFYCVDTWEGSEEHLDKNNPSYEPLLQTKDALYETFLHNIKTVKDVINPIRLSSIEASKIFEDESINFIMVDASHDYYNVKNDLEHWYPKLKTGGIIAGDDFKWEGVNKAVKEFFKKDFIHYGNVVWCNQKKRLGSSAG